MENEGTEGLNGKECMKSGRYSTKTVKEVVSKNKQRGRGWESEGNMVKKNKREERM